MRRIVRRPAGRSGGFTITELLVVIGIMAVLMGLLLPSLGRVREVGRSVKCLASLRTIGQAGELHAADHDGYLPAAGWHFDLKGGRCDPKGLGDGARRRYTYYMDGGVQRPAPITAVLAAAMGRAVDLDSRESLSASLERPDIHELFHCPSEDADAPRSGISQREDGVGWTAPPERSSYVFNEALLGKGDPKVRTRVPSRRWESCRECDTRTG